MKRLAQPKDDMVEELTDEKRITKLTKSSAYPEISKEMREQSISKAIRFQSDLLANAYQRGRIDLRNTDEVMMQTVAYMRACEETATVPTMMQLSAAFGLSRQAMNTFIQKYSEHPTAQFLVSVRTAFASTIASLSLTKSLDAATSIFLLKNSNQMLSDSPPQEICEEPIPEEEITAKELAQQFKDIYDQSKLGKK